MESEPTPDEAGKPPLVSVPFYPARLSAQDISMLMHLAKNRLQQRPAAACFWHWLIGILQTEVDRKISSDEGIPTDVDPVFIDAIQWSGRELGDALCEAIALTTPGTLPPAPQAFCVAARAAILTVATLRLQQYDIPISPLDPPDSTP